MSIRVGVILAAGRGRRMGDLGDRYPKALLPVANEPLILHQIRFLRGLGVQEVYVVVGYRRLDIVTALGDGTASGVRLHYVEQQQRLGIAHAVGRLRTSIREPFLLLLGDYFFCATDVERLLSPLERDDDSIAMAAKREPNRRALTEACALSVDGDGRIHTIVEKPTVPASDLKGCGIYALRPAFFDAVNRTPRTALRDEYELTVALDLYINMGKPVYAAEIIEWDVNLTRPQDLLACNLRFLEQTGQTYLLAPGAKVEQNVVLERAVIGKETRISSALRLKEVVVFPGVELNGGGTLERGLATADGFISCPAVEMSEIRAVDPVSVEGE